MPSIVLRKLDPAALVKLKHRAALDRVSVYSLFSQFIEAYGNDTLRAYDVQGDTLRSWKPVPNIVPITPAAKNSSTKDNIDGKSSQG